VKKNQTESTLDKFISIVDTDGNNAKRDLIATYAGDADFLRALRFYLDDNALTGLKAGKFKKDCRSVGDALCYDLGALLDYLSVNNTGRSEDVGVAQRFIDNFSGRQAETLYQLLIKRIEGFNVGISLANAAIPDFMVELKDDCMLCDKYWDDPDYWQDRDVEVDPKLDGYRIRVEKHDGQVQIFSRSGKPVTDLPDVVASAMKSPMDDFVLDGERMPKGFQTMTKSEQFKAVQNSKKTGKDNSGIVIGVYDGMSYDEWKSHKGVTVRRDRVAFIKKVIAGCGPNIEFCEPLWTGKFDADHVIEVFNEETKKDKEGVILKDLDAVYEWDRTKAQVKIKEVFDADVTVTELFEGTGKNRGKLGAVLIEGDARVSKHTTETVHITTTKCGSGFNDEEREYYWNHQDELLGKTIEILYMQVSESKDGTPSLRMPRFKTIKTGE
jgi:DNA ligase-1